MTGKEALDLANFVLKTVGDVPLTDSFSEGTEKEKVEAVLRAYMVRLKKNVPRHKDIQDDRLIPDIVVQRIREELKKMENPLA